jgi:GNAT superfamily N-acetyltransferase
MASQERVADLRIDAATEADAPVLLRLIRGLAEYERLLHRVVATEEALRTALCGLRPVAEAVIARVGDEAVGFAVYFPSFSTFAGRPNMYLEDLYVEPQWRRQGVGRRLFAHVAKVAAARGWGQMNWSVLAWNEPALDFYRGLGAEPVKDWVGYKLGGDTFHRLAGTRD